MTRDQAMMLINNERRRQMSVEGYSADHDDKHERGDLMQAAMCYLHSAHGLSFCRGGVNEGIPYGWPWASAYWKPKDTLRDLVRAGALMLAEKERLIRQASAINATAHVGHIDHKINIAINRLMDFTWNAPPPQQDAPGQVGRKEDI